MAHEFTATIRWERGDDPFEVRTYSRDHWIEGEGKLAIPASADPAFLGDGTKWNPEELFVASLSQCHMLWFLYLAAKEGVRVDRYVDHPVARLEFDVDGVGRFTEATLRPEVVAAGTVEQIADLHGRAHRLCFVANSSNFPTRVEPVQSMEGAPSS